jgi:hypothetical protein
MENEVSVRLQRDTAEKLPEPKYINGYKETQNVQIGAISIVLAENLKADSPYLVCNRVKGEEYHHSAFPGYVSAIQEFMARQTSLVNLFVNERNNRAGQGVDSTMLTASHCLSGSDKEDFKGKLIVVKATELSPEFRYADSQLMLCSHGNGARPDAIGTSVFGTELFSGNSVCYGRHQILGIADEGKLPQWA